MNILLSAAALERHRDLLDEVRPEGARWLTLGPGGERRVDGGHAEWHLSTSPPEVAWRTTDLLRGGLLRDFYSLVSGSKRLRWLQSCSAGFDSPVLTDLVRRGVRVTTSHIAGPPIAEFVLRAAMDHMQNAGAWREAAAHHQWKPHEFVEMASTRWLVIGLGEVGSAVSRRARAFGAHVTGIRRSSAAAASAADAVATPDQVGDLLPSSDVVVLAAPANSETVGLVGPEFLRRMKASSVLINVGRGSLVDERALLRSLDSGRPGRAILDVAASEPLPAEAPLWSHPNVVITPHNAALGNGRHGRAASVFASNLQRYERGESLAHEVHPTDV